MPQIDPRCCSAPGAGRLRLSPTECAILGFDHRGRVPPGAFSATLETWEQYLTELRSLPGFREHAAEHPVGRGNGGDEARGGDLNGPASAEPQVATLWHHTQPALLFLQPFFLAFFSFPDFGFYR
jgi:hypothetical protein